MFPLRSFIVLMLLLFSILTHSQSILLKKINIIDIVTGKIVKKQHVLIEDEKIKSITRRLPRKRDGTITIKAGGKYLIPGLWDMHVHLSMIGESSFPLFIANGITGVRDMGGDIVLLANWRSQEEQGEWKYPVIRTPGPIIESHRFVEILSYLLGTDFSKSRVPVENPGQVIQVIDSLKKLKVDFIKIRNVASAEVFQALADECKKHGIAFTGHIPPNMDINTAIEAGMTTVEHIDFLQIINLDDSRKNEILESITDHAIWFTPTLTAFINSRLTPAGKTNDFINDSLNSTFSKRKYLSPGLLEHWAIEIELGALEPAMQWDILYRAFISFAQKLASKTRLLAGTDAGVRQSIPGWSLHEELQVMVNELKLTPLQALQAATIEPVKLLNISETHGAIAANYQANLVILNKNPLANITHTQSIFAVIKDGRYLDQSGINHLLLEVEAMVTKELECFQPLQLRYLQSVLNR